MEIIRISYFYDHPLQGYGRLDDTNEIVAFMILEDDGWTKLSDIIDMNIIEFKDSERIFTKNPFDEKYKDLDKTTIPDISDLDPDRYHGRNNMNDLLIYFGEDGGWNICVWSLYSIYLAPSDIDIDKWINPIEANWKFIKNLSERYVHREKDCKYCV